MDPTYTKMAGIMTLKICTHNNEMSHKPTFTRFGLGCMRRECLFHFSLLSPAMFSLNIIITQCSYNLHGVCVHLYIQQKYAFPFMCCTSGVGGGTSDEFTELLSCLLRNSTKNFSLNFFCWSPKCISFIIHVCISHHSLTEILYGKTNTTQTNAFNKSIESSILLLHSIEFHQQPPTYSNADWS